MKALAPVDVWIRTSWCNQEVAGEYYHAEAWRRFFPRKLPAAGVELTDQALLIREPNNRHDRNAVRVEVRGQHVGHLPAEDAARYRATLDHLATRGFVVRTHTRLWAGPDIEYQVDRRGELREVDTGKVNCRITLALPEPHLLVPLNPPPPEPHAMLPMGGSVMVKTDGVPITVFESVLTDSGEGWVHATLHELHEQLPRSVRELVEVRIDGVRVGTMTPAMSKKFLPVVRALADQGRLCATPAIVRGNRLNVEVRVHGTQAADLPQEWLLEHANHALAANPPTNSRQPPTNEVVPSQARPERSTSAYPPPEDPAVREAVTPLASIPELKELVAGQNVPLVQSQLRVNLLASHADLSVLLVGANGRVDRDEDFIFYNNPRSADGAVTLTANSATVATDQLPPRCERVVLIVSTDSGAMADATAVLHQSGNGVDLRFSPADTARVSALVWGEIYLRNSNWRLRAVGQGWSDGLAGLARDYGVNVD